MNTLFIITMVLIALLFALFAWAPGASRTANQVTPRRQKGFRRHWRKFYLTPLLMQRVFGYLPGARAPRGGVQFANIGEGTFETGVKSYLPDAATTARYLCYKIGTDGDHVAVAGAGEVPIGQSDDQADAGVPIAINLFGVKTGLLRVVTDGSIANGDYVKTAANGQVTKATTGDAGQIGRALFGTDVSSAAGDVIPVIHGLSSKLSF